MATRLETASRQQLMRSDITENCRSGRLRSGDRLPTVRELANEYGLSVNIANKVIQALVTEGVLHARPGAGIVAGNPRPSRPGTYLFLLPDGLSSPILHLNTAHRAFEVTIAQLGGACLALETAEAREHARLGQLPPLAGIFSLAAHGLLQVDYAGTTPCACFGELTAEQASRCPVDFDSVRFDDYQGGYQAAAHLLDAGHQNIALLGLHAPDSLGAYTWSAERERGWRDALRAAGHDTEGLSFHPTHSPVLPVDKFARPEGSEQFEAAAQAMKGLLPAIQQGRVDAVVAVNLFAAKTLFNSLRAAQIPLNHWPAVICFDGFDGLGNHLVSALNLPWDEVGKAGAQLLWERNVDRLRGPGTVRQIPMQLIPRLTCQPAWGQVPAFVMPQLDLLARNDRTVMTA